MKRVAFLLVGLVLFCGQARGANTVFNLHTAFRSNINSIWARMAGRVSPIRGAKSLKFGFGLKQFLSSPLMVQFRRGSLNPWAIMVSPFKLHAEDEAYSQSSNQTEGHKAVVNFHFPTLLPRLALAITIACLFCSGANAAYQDSFTNAVLTLKGTQ